MLVAGNGSDDHIAVGAAQVEIVDVRAVEGASLDADDKGTVAWKGIGSGIGSSISISICGDVIVTGRRSSVMEPVATVDLRIEAVWLFQLLRSSRN